MADLSAATVASVQMHIERARLDLEQEVYGAVYEAVQKFKERTGLTPRRIDVEMLDVTACHNRQPTFIPGKVKATVEL
jgi:hypothetical protein